MKRKKMVYRMRGKHDGGFMFWVVPKDKSPHGKDDIQMMWCNSQEAKEGKEHNCYLQDWEALAIIQGLTYALMEKEGTRLIPFKKNNNAAGVEKETVIKVIKELNKMYCANQDPLNAATAWQVAEDLGKKFKINAEEVAKICEPKPSPSTQKGGQNNGRTNTRTNRNI